MNAHRDRFRPLMALVLIALAGCEVVNPGQILDADLDLPSSYRVLVNGMAGQFAEGLDDINWNTSVMTGDLAGTSAYTSRIRHWEGRPDPEDAGDYDSLHAARWVINNGIQRMENVLGEEFNTSALAAEAHLWAGYANRLLGETMCQALIEGGAAQPREVYLEAAETHFSRAIEIGAASGTSAATIVTAARGGRASVRINLDDWSGAITDAAAVPDDFVFSAIYHPGAITNTIWTETQSRVNLNVKHTWFEAYYAESDDPRTPWFLHSRTVVAADGTTQQLMQNKYTSNSADVALTKGAEMRLIEAEAMLRTGDWQGAMTVINGLRSAVGVDPWSVANAAEAFDALKKERAIVLWMEARRAGDLYRWGGNPTEDPLLVAMKANAPNILLEGRATCHPFSDVMIATNPNI